VTEYLIVVNIHQLFYWSVQIVDSAAPTRLCHRYIFAARWPLENNRII